MNRPKEAVLEINKRLKEEGFKTVIGYLVHDDYTVIMPKEEMENTKKYERIQQIIMEELLINSI
jgi:DNA polymerase I-like protein with 3'-5' exonuclease and polymerase domains